MKNIKLVLSLSVLSALVFSLVVSTGVSAHVVVKPGEAGVATYQTFVAGVPSEKNNPTTTLRLVIPEGLQSVTPNAKPGWAIDIKKDGSGDDAKIVEITWSGGQIPAGQRDDFVFSAKTPAAPTALQWKAYQTYSDGTVVAWDKSPSAGGHGHGSTPYSQTKIVDDLTTDNMTHGVSAQNDDVRLNIALGLGIAAVMIALLSLIRTVDIPGSNKAARK